MRGLAWALGLLVAGSACSAGGGGAVEGGVQDAAIFEVTLYLPDGCPPEVGNEKGVGIACTKGGNQCKSPLRCTCDPFFGITLTGVPCLCTLAQLAQVNSTDPCGPPLPANFCGSNTKCCPYQTAAAYCVPTICLPDNMCPDVVGP
jgi:hypothetical protein